MTSDDLLTFTVETWMTAQDVWVKAAEDDDAVAGVATIEHAVSGGDYASVTASSVTATESDNDAAGVTVSPTALAVAEGDSVKYSVVLDTQPSGDVTVAVSLAAGSDEDITVSDESLTFTPETWMTAQDVWVKAAEDEDGSNGTATIEHTVSGGDYGGISVSSVTATESDNDAAGVTVNPTALSVAEGDSVKYSVALTTQPSADVTIAVSLAAGSDEDVTVSDESLTFTAETWSTAQDVWVRAAEDDDASAGVATIEHSVSGGDYASVTASSVTATESDNDAAGVTVNPTALAVAEGDSVKYSVVLKTQPSADVTIAASLAAGSDEDVTVSDESLTFTTETWSTAQDVWVKAAEDDDAISGVATIEHSVSGGDYASVTASSVTATESDNDAAGVTVNPTALAVAEGDSVKYSVVLDTQPSADVTIAVSLAAGSDEDVTVSDESLTFTTETWSTAQDVWVKAAEDDDAISGAATIEHAVSGGDYASVTASSVTATESDNDAAGVTVSPTALAVAEGDSVKYSVVLKTQPSADVTIAVSLAAGSDEDVTVSDESLTFTTETWSTAQDVWVKAAEDDDAVGGTATIEHAVSGGDYNSVTASSVTATESDNDTAGVTVKPTTLAVTEGSNAKYTVVLDTKPSGDVTIDISLASGSDADITVSDESLTFTPETWSTAQEVTVSAAADNDAVRGAATIEHTASGGDYGSVSVASVTATELETGTQDAPKGIKVTPTALMVAEDDSVKYSVALTTQPSADVTIAVSLAAGSDEDITVSDESLTFTPEAWSTAQDVWVKAAEDDDAISGAATIEHSVSGGDYASVTASSVTATESDNDAAGVTVNPTALAVAEGDSVKYSVVLDTQPSGDVTIAVSLAAGSDEDITVSDESLTFTAETWMTAQDVWVKAAEDDDAVAGVATIEHAVSGGDYNNVTASSVTATESDNDAAGVTVNPTALTVAEGDSVKYSVVLDTQPSGDVTVAVSLASDSDEDITVSDESLTFTAETWMTAQEVWVKAAEDEDGSNGTATIEHTVSGGDYNSVTASSVTATESDNDAAGVTVNPTALTVAEGDSVKYSVVLTTQPSGDVTVAISLASGSDEDVTVSDESLTFTAETWSTAQDVWVRAAEDDDGANGTATIEHSVSGGDYASVTASSVTATESDNDAAGVTINPTALAVAEGDSVKYSVVLKTKPSADVTVTASLAADSDEDVTVSDESLTFTSETWSTAQDVWVKAAEDDDASAGVATIEHSISGGDYASVTASSVTATESDNDAAGVTVNPTALAVAGGRQREVLCRAQDEAFRRRNDCGVSRYRFGRRHHSE